jgi:hypothetical protein
VYFEVRTQAFIDKGDELLSEDGEYPGEYRFRGLYDLHEWILLNCAELTKGRIRTSLHLVNKGYSEWCMVPYRCFKKYWHGYMDAAAGRKTLNAAYYRNRHEEMMNS